jgi:UDP-N-acetylmuramoyl-L-alanyl-D-glutamate--2,6-diaminopimelate ligase
MEVSSHGLDQGRVNGTVFDVAVLTNLSRDHFDYHGSHESYASAKRRLFEMPGLSHAVLNLDDRFGCNLAEMLRGKDQVLGYSLNGEEHSFKTVVRAIRHEFDAKGFHLDIESPWGRGELSCKLMGRFNAENVLATLATLLVLGIPFEESLRRLRRLRAVAGRMEAFGGKDEPLVVVDYAHTPAALQHALSALQEHCRGRLWCVFGCGGDRDAGKRVQMGRASECFADQIILTDDNPRNESPEAIVRDILTGFTSLKRVSVIHERSRAIATAIGQAQLDDVVLVAGKGHEQVQVTRNQNIPFSDKEQVLTYLQGLSR